MARKSSVPQRFEYTCAPVRGGVVDWDAEVRVGAPRRLTARQLRMLRFIADRLDTVGYPPTRREIAAALGVPPASVHDQVTRLRLAGWLEPSAGRQARALRPAPPTAQALADRVRTGGSGGGGRG